MKRKLRAILVFIFAMCMHRAGAQQAAFFNDIQNFKKQDSINPPPQHAILFVGSSSFTKWKDVQDYFPETKIINRGFGGSSLPDLIRYANDIIFPYNPKQVVIYCGDNDFVVSDTVTADVVISRVQKLFYLIRNKLPSTHIAYISIKPSPSRARFMQKAEAANKAIKHFLAKQRNTAFIDVYHLMLDGNGRPMPAIFLDDSLHMNAKGYLIWQKAIKPVLTK